jgi:hypothetical protein
MHVIPTYDVVGGTGRTKSSSSLSSGGGPVNQSINRIDHNHMMQREMDGNETTGMVSPSGGGGGGGGGGTATFRLAGRV